VSAVSVRTSGRVTGNAALQIRAALPADVARIAAIYGDHVLDGTASFEEVPPAAEEMARRLASVQDSGLPWLVAERDGRMVGYAYAGLYNARAAYRHTVEDSVYVDAACAGQGIGTVLLTALLEQCTALGYRQMVAIVGDSGNTASLRLHERLGFRHIGTLERVGFKFGRWLDVVMLQRTLGNAD
jgi:phosphinothricin acetyltransferase